MFISEVNLELTETVHAKLTLFAAPQSLKSKPVHAK